MLHIRFWSLIFQRPGQHIGANLPKVQSRYCPHGHYGTLHVYMNMHLELSGWGGGLTGKVEKPACAHLGVE